MGPTGAQAPRGERSVPWRSGGRPVHGFRINQEEPVRATRDRAGLLPRPGIRATARILDGPPARAASPGSPRGPRPRASREPPAAARHGGCGGRIRWPHRRRHPREGPAPGRCARRARGENHRAGGHPHHRPPPLQQGLPCRAQALSPPPRARSAGGGRDEGPAAHSSGGFARWTSSSACSGNQTPAAGSIISRTGSSGPAPQRVHCPSDSPGVLIHR